MKTARASLWVVFAAVYIVFCIWYTNLDGPLREDEIEHYISKFVANGAPEEQLTRVRKFMEEDTGRHFIMVNSLDLNESPPDLPATGPNATANELLNHYMEHMYPELLLRASHPVFFGTVVASAMDISGIQGAQEWDQGALFRYRSRRDLVDIASNPAFAERHDYKMGGLTKTIAYPVEPSLYYADARFVLALVLFSLASVLDLILYRRR